MARGQILVTGFRPFGGHAANPSETVARRIAASPPAGARVESAVLPVEYARAFLGVREALDRLRPAAVLHLGLAADRKTPEFERFALNWRGAAGPDEAGARIEGEPIDPAGPAAYLATAPVDDLVAACRAAGVPCRASSHAGTFLCNQVLYQTLRWADLTGAPLRAAFVHLPNPAPPGTEGFPEDDLVRGVAAAVACLAALPPARRREARPAGGKRSRARVVRSSKGR